MNVASGFPKFPVASSHVYCAPLNVIEYKRMGQNACKCIITGDCATFAVLQYSLLHREQFYKNTSRRKGVIIVQKKEMKQ